MKTIIKLIVGMPVLLQPLHDERKRYQPTDIEIVDGTIVKVGSKFFYVEYVDLDGNTQQITFKRKGYHQESPRWYPSWAIFFSREAYDEAKERKRLNHLIHLRFRGESSPYSLKTLQQIMALVEAEDKARERG